ncbi:antiviral reverse transcriptase Drt3a [Sphingobacterium sp.]|uniref:antiviral reverse transcriptase Drt3a n=1 Tax=Sphingobacterium sp. TaxID=341027 RepID=UPI0031D081D7
MIDQSYSADNFYRILDYENRKGNYKEGEFFENIKLINYRIKDFKREYRVGKKDILDGDEKQRFKQSYREGLKEMQEDKMTLLLEELHKVSNNIVNDNWNLALVKQFDRISGKHVFVTGNTPETFFALKQTQYCIKKLYKVKQSHRNNIVLQVKHLLEDGAPKVVLRADVKNFFETIPIERLLRKINKDNLLSQLAKKIISRVIKKYHTLSDNMLGIPRGIGISAYLSELYLREFDEAIRNLPRVFYYARYVDDIIIFLSTDDADKEEKLRELIADILERTSGLELNLNKTSAHIIANPNTDLNIPKEIEYLGYKFLVKKKEIQISLSEKKVSNYKKKIDKLIYIYTKSCKNKKEKKLLVNGIRFLTTNTRLLNNKSNVLIGVYYSNALLTDLSIWDMLDNYVRDKLQFIGANGINEYIESKGYLFRRGFENKKFTAFRALQMTTIIKSWK